MKAMLKGYDKEMNFTIGRYEFKNLGENKWQTVSEKIVMQKLVDNFNPVTPIIIKMLSGEEIVTSQGIYRRAE
ncbi:MAG: hypothetical protein PVG52_15140 [Desulfobacterales bacterium]